MRTMLYDKILKFAKFTIEEQEGSPPVIRDWRVVEGHLHFITVSVRLAIGKSYFEVWVYVNLDTEELWL